MILNLLFAVLAFALSPYAIFAYLLGITSFILLPIVPKLTNQFQIFARLHLRLAGWVLRRFCLVLTNQNDLLLKSLTPTERGYEKITLDGEEKEITDPAATKHYWLGAQFGLVDGDSGLMFDPRHAAHGVRKRAAEEQGTYRVPATDGEWSQYDIAEWIRGVWEFPEGVHELVDLSGIRQLVDGGERAEYPKRLEELYKHHRDPYGSGPDTTRLIMLIVALLAPFGFLWFLASQGTASGGSTVTYGVLAAAGLHGLLSDVDRRQVLVGVAVLLPLPALLVLVGLIAGPLFAGLLSVFFTLGFLTIPMFALPARAVGAFGGWYGSQMFALGLLGYERPVLEWTPRSYRLRDVRDIEQADDSTWYGVGYGLLGVSFDPVPSSWGSMTVSTGEIEDKRLADGGSVSESNVPAGFEPVPDAPALRRGNRGGFVPKRFDRGSYYVHTGISRGRFADGANGERCLKRLLWSKEKYGGVDGLSEKQLIVAMGVLGTISMAAGLGVFFL